MNVANEFRLPIFGVRRWRKFAPLAGVSMPEAAVNENHFPPSPEYEVRPSRKFASMQTVAVAEPMNQSPNDYFRRSTCAADTGHAAASLLGR